MYSEGVQCVVILELRLHHSHHKEAYDGRNYADAERSEQTGRACGGRYCNQSGHGSGARSHGGRLLVEEPVDSHPHYGGGSRGYVSHHEGVCGDAVCGQSATRVEAEPSQPKERSAEEHEGDVVRRDGMSCLVVLPLADEQSHDKRRYAGVDVDYGTPGEVDCAHLLQEAAAPYPVSHGEIGQHRPQDDEQHVALELDSLGESAED